MNQKKIKSTSEASIRNNPWVVLHMNNPSVDELSLAVSIDPDIYKYLPNPHIKISLKAVEINPWMIRLVKHQTDQLHYLCVNEPTSYEFLIDPSDQIKLKFLRDYPFLIDKMQPLTEKFIIKAIKVYPRVLKYIDSSLITEKMMEIALLEDIDCFPFFAHVSTNKINKLAISQNGYFIRFIKDQTEELQCLAVSNTSHSIWDIFNPCPKAQKISAQNFTWSFNETSNKKDIAIYFIKLKEFFNDNQALCILYHNLPNFLKPYFKNHFKINNAQFLLDQIKTKS